MQNQAVKTPQHQTTLSVEQSLTSVQTLLRAGLGCITYLRNLLPEDNFNESYLTSSSAPSLSSQPQDGRSFSMDSNSKRNVSGFKIMTISRGFTDEADTLLNYMENGIFDALEKQYLKSFIFAVCLDGQDPNNIVEAYTFNFKYHIVPGTNLKVPVMSLGDDLMKLSLNGLTSNASPEVPVAKGKIPTLGDVKKSLRMLARNLIQATTQMEALPKRRFATFKLFYYDHTPDDYNPPHFRQGDVERDRWFFSTHDISERPEKCSVGTLETGWHGVDVRITSVASFLPSSDDNNATFTGTTHGLTAIPALTPAEQNAKSLQQYEIQMQDAKSRRIMYDADGLCDEDADGEDELDYSPSTPNDDSPIGMRGDDDSIVPLPVDTESRNSPMEVDATSAAVPENIGQLNATSPGQLLEQTQPLLTQRSPSATPRPQGFARMKSVSLPPSDLDEESFGILGSRGFDTQILRERLMDAFPEASGTADTEMLDMETQMPSYTNEDPIESFQTESAEPRADRIEVTDKGLKCECGVNDEDSDTCYCEDCGHWYHIWCMGYNTAKDKSLPERFSCFDCRVRADKNWELIERHDLYSRMIIKFKEVALFRRALKIFELKKPDNVSSFTKKVKCASDVAGQLFRRLEAEGFIAQQNKESDELGLMEVHKPPTRGKGNVPEKKQRKQLQRSKYIFLLASKKTVEYKEYFNPDPVVERRLLGLDLLKPQKKLRDVELNVNVSPAAEAAQSSPPTKAVHVLAPDTQTQDDSQYPTLPIARKENTLVSDLKRKARDEDNRRSKTKKSRISVATLVDLGE